MTVSSVLAWKDGWTPTTVMGFKVCQIHLPDFCYQIGTSYNISTWLKECCGCFFSSIRIDKFHLSDISKNHE